MIVAALVLILSTAIFFFFFQVTCQKILSRQVDREYSQSIAKVIRLEFPFLRKSMEEVGAQVDYSRLPKKLKCDFLALTYLLRNVQNARQGYSKEERLLILYFRWQLFSLAVRHLLNVDERRAILKLTSVLEYFANLVGQRVNTVGFGNLNVADHLFSNS